MAAGGCRACAAAAAAAAASMRLIDLFYSAAASFTHFISQPSNPESVHVPQRRRACNSERIAHMQQVTPACHVTACVAIALQRSVDAYCYYTCICTNATRTSV
jgi:hypothetical protein